LASIADDYVTLFPETSKIAEGLKKASAEVVGATKHAGGVHLSGQLA
jgi:hypothetical protein